MTLTAQQRQELDVNGVRSSPFVLNSFSSTRRSSSLAAAVLTRALPRCHSQFTVMESFFQGEELDALVCGVEEVAMTSWGENQPLPGGGTGVALPVRPGDGSDGGARSGVSAAAAMYPGYTPGIDQVFLDLCNHPRILPYVVDSIGHNSKRKQTSFAGDYWAFLQKNTDCLRFSPHAGRAVLSPEASRRHARSTLSGVALRSGGGAHWRHSRRQCVCQTPIRGALALGAFAFVSFVRSFRFVV